MLDATAPPFDPVDSRRPCGRSARSRMLPRDAYVSPRVFAFEQERFFAGSWTCVGREATSKEFGRPWAVQVSGAGSAAGPRDRRAGAGLRQHLPPPGPRAARRGRADHQADRALPYHAWTYDLDGALRAARVPATTATSARPSTAWSSCRWRAGTGSCSSTARATPAVRRARRNTRRAGRPLPAGAAGPPGQPLADLACNWKVVLENYHECYHCPLIHPELCQVSPPASGDNFELDGAWVGGTMDLKDHAATMSLDGHSDGVPIPGLDAERLRTVAYLGLFPNLLLSLHPDYLMTHLVEPLGPTSATSSAPGTSRPRRPSGPASTRRARSSSGDGPTARTGRPASRCSAAWPRPLPTRAPRPGRGRRLPRGDDDRPRLPGRAAERLPARRRDRLTQEPSPVR